MENEIKTHLDYTLMSFFLITSISFNLLAFLYASDHSSSFHFISFYLMAFQLHSNPNVLVEPKEFGNLSGIKTTIVTESFDIPS